MGCLASRRDGIRQDSWETAITHPKRSVESVIPIVVWIRHYDRGWLRGDVIAGVTVAALIVPKNLDYAGIPLEHGLYAAAAGAILYAIFGTCRQISVGPSSGLAAVTASAVVATGIDDPSRSRASSPASPSPRASSCC